MKIRLPGGNWSLGRHSTFVVINENNFLLPSPSQMTTKPLSISQKNTLFPYAHPNFPFNLKIDNNTLKI